MEASMKIYAKEYCKTNSNTFFFENKYCKIYIIGGKMKTLSDKEIKNIDE